MGISSIFTALSIIFGTGALVAWLFAFLATRLNRVIFEFGLLQWGIMSILFFLAAIWFKLGAIYHKK